MVSKHPTHRLILLLLPAMVWLFFNTTANRHFHVLSEGYIVSHSHPFEKSGTIPGDSNPHRHTTNELMLLSLFNGIAWTFLLVLAAAPKLHNDPQPAGIRVVHQVPGKEYFQVFHYHAPPMDY